MQAVKTMSIKTYSELITLPTFEERFLYLKLDGSVGKETFGFKRWLNQEFYHSDQWLQFRDEIIIRDEGCDLGMPGYEIFGSVLIHHLNPITYEDMVGPFSANLNAAASHSASSYGAALSCKPLAAA